MDRPQFFSVLDIVRLARTGKIDHLWEAYQETALKGRLGTEEEKKAFYMGCFAFMEFNLHIIGDDSISESQGVRTLDRMFKELYAFAEKEGLTRG